MHMCKYMYMYIYSLMYVSDDFSHLVQCTCTLTTCVYMFNMYIMDLGSKGLTVQL